MEIDWNEFEFDTSGVMVGDDEVSPPAAEPSAVPASGAVISEQSSFYYFDIETVPDYDRVNDFGLPPVPDTRVVQTLDEVMSPEEALSQTVNEIKMFFARNNPCDQWLAIAREIESNSKGRKGVFDLLDACLASRTAVDDTLRAQAKKMSTTPEMCRIITLGFAFDTQAAGTMIVGVDGVTEQDILEQFWIHVTKAQQIVGFNILEFDLPVIMVRSMLLKVPSTRQLDLSRDYNRNILDLFKLRFGKYKSEAAEVKTSRGLKSLCRQLGIEIPVDDIDGSKVAETYKTNPLLVGEYCKSDTVCTRKLHRMMSGYFC